MRHKEMLPVGRKRTIQSVVEEIYDAEIKEILIVTNKQKRAIEEHFAPDGGVMNCLSKGS